MKCKLTACAWFSPILVARDALALQIAKRVVLVDAAKLSDLNEQTKDGVFINASHTSNGANRTTFNQAANHSGATI